MKTEARPMKHTHTQAESPNAVASPTPRSEMAVQTDPTELSLAVSPPRPRANERETSEIDPPETVDPPQRSSSKSDVTAATARDDDEDDDSTPVPASETSTGARKKRKTMCVTDLHAKVAYASRNKRLRLSVTPAAAPPDALTAELPLETMVSESDRPRRPPTRPRTAREDAFDFDSDVESADPAPRPRRANVDAVLEQLPATAASSIPAVATPVYLLRAFIGSFHRSTKKTTIKTKTTTTTTTTTKTAPFEDRAPARRGCENRPTRPTAEISLADISHRACTIADDDIDDDACASHQLSTPSSTPSNVEPRARDETETSARVPKNSLFSPPTTFYIRRHSSPPRARAHVRRPRRARGKARWCAHAHRRSSSRAERAQFGRR